MNILASYNWIKEFLDTDQSVENFSDEMSAKSMSVEHIDDLAKKFENMVIGHVKELKAHPDADKLRIAVTDIGSDTVEIVCGGANLKEGQQVLVALPGARVCWHGEGDLVTLKETKIRGVNSFGMICAPEEVGFDKAPCGEKDIWDLTDLIDASPGTTFADAFDLHDYLLDIEVTTNRPDSMNIIGLAREAGVATEGNFTWKPSTLPSAGQGKNLNVQVEVPELCSRYMAVVIDGVKVGPSPAWLQRKILLSGHRPINNIVDITNFILHEYGQPMHTFDYTKITGESISVRHAKEGELFTALDEKEYTLQEKHLVITDAEKPIALAGVMGGLDSGTTEQTQTIVLEAATFDALNVRRTARALNLYSDSQSMFEKGLSTASVQAAMARAIELILEIAGGSVASEIIDERAEEYQLLIFPFSPQKARDLMGVDVSDEDQIALLEDLGFTLQRTGDQYQVTVPYWRDHDIEHSVDLTEEVARMFGYHNIPSRIPKGEIPLQVKDNHLIWEEWLRQELRASGYTEFFSYSFTGKDAFEKYDLDAEKAVALFNPLSSELTHMRTSLIPSLLMSVEDNQGKTPSGKVFEIARIYLPNAGDLPEEKSRMYIAHYGVEDAQYAFQALKGVLEQIERRTGIDLTLVRETDNPHWHPTRSAKVLHGDRVIGIFGQVADEYQAAFGIDKPVFVIDIDIEALIPSMKEVSSYTEASDFPAVRRDLSILVDRKATFADIGSAMKKCTPMIEEIDLVEVYRGKGIPEGKKSMTFGIRFRAPDKTLSAEMVEGIMEAIIDELRATFHAVMR